MRQGYCVKALDLDKESDKTAAIEEALQKAGTDPDKIVGGLNQSEEVDSKSSESDSKDGGDTDTRAKSGGTTSLKSPAGKSPKCGVQFHKLPDGK